MIPKPAEHDAVEAADEEQGQDVGGQEKRHLQEKNENNLISDF